MSRKNIRRHHRVPYLGKVFISWEDPHGQPRFARGKCVDVSEEGMRIETPEPIPVFTNVSIRADQIMLAGSGTVKHLERRGSHYTLGLELSQALRDQTLNFIRESETSVDPLPVVASE